MHITREIDIEQTFTFRGLKMHRNRAYGQEKKKKIYLFIVTYWLKPGLVERLNKKVMYFNCGAEENC